LASFLLIPEIRSADQFFGLGKLSFFGGRVKDSSAQLLPAAGA